MKSRRIGIFAITIILIMTFTAPGYAVKEKQYSLTQEKDRLKTQHDNGYCYIEDMDKNDPHFKWGLGTFYIQGFTEVVFDEDGTPVFLKNVGDELILGFDLKQNIDKLNGNKDIKVSEDTNGYDGYFEVEPTNFGRGCLIVSETDYKNTTHKPVIYEDYLTAVQNKTANTIVKPFAEGNYIIKLDYEVQYPGFLGSTAFNDYTIYTSFKIRNSNCMVFFYKTGEIQDEITNGAVAEDGFRIDFKNSYFLNVNVSKEILVDNNGIFTLDTRFNRAASDGSEYKDEGLYTITISNQYTKEKVTKKISVGRNKVLNVYAAYNGTMDLNEIAKKLDQGAEINDQWLLILPEAKAEDSFNSQENSFNGFSTTDSSGNQKEDKDKGPVTPVNIGIFALIVIVFIIAIKTIEKQRKRQGEESDETDTSSEKRDVPTLKDPADDQNENKDP